MRLIETLDDVFLGSLRTLCHLLYKQIDGITGAPGWTLIAMGVIINLLLLPLYFKMEESGRDQRALREKVDKEVRRIKDNFTGREAYFYIRTIHRVHNYSPIRVLFQSSDLFVQVIVFSTMYRYIASLKALKGVEFGPIADLAQPDGLLWGVHLLPFVMTALNLASVFAYDKAKRKQGVVLAVLFLVLLYSSPAGLVLYWTASNLFSWLRNVVSRGASKVTPPQLQAWARALVTQR